MATHERHHTRTEHRFDYYVVIVSSSFGGSVAALRAAEKGYRVGVMESGRRRKGTFGIRGFVQIGEMGATLAEAWRS